MRCEVAVVGGGLSGFAAAIGLAREGFDTVLLAPPAPLDARSTALIGSSVEYLQEIGVWRGLEPKAQPLVTMRIVDDTGRLFRAPTVDFRAGDIDRPSFGSNVLNVDLHAALRREAEGLSSRLEIVEDPVDSLETVEDGVRLRLVSGRDIRTCLVVAADGRNSLVRAAAGIGVRTWSYPQSAIVLNFQHEKEHRGVSTEFHTRHGPVTQVPLPGRRSSLVWVERPELADLVPDVDRERLSREIEARLHSLLGTVEVEPGLQVFPLSGAQAERLTATRVALIGEAAHVFPPIGAQGLNLGLRDAAAIIEAARHGRDDPGATGVLSRYAADRRLDVASRSRGIDLLNRSLLAGFLPTQFARAAGLTALSAFGPVRRFAMREGLSPGAGLRAFLPRRRGPEARRQRQRGA